MMYYSIMITIIASTILISIVCMKIKKRRIKFKKILEKTKKYANINEELYMDFLINLEQRVF